MMKWEDTAIYPILLISKKKNEFFQMIFENQIDSNLVVVNFLLKYWKFTFVTLLIILVGDLD